MVISSTLSAPNFTPTANTNKTHKHSHAAAGKASIPTQPDAGSASEVSAENQVAATPINDLAGALQSLQAARNAMLQQPAQAMQAQANLDPQTVYNLLVS